MSKLLQNITVAYSADGVNAGATQRTYTFNYTPSTDKLWNIDLTAADGSKMNSTYINWNNTSGELGKSKIGAVYDPNLSNGGSETSSIQFADLDGDGWTDRIYWWCGNSIIPGYVIICLYNPSTNKHDYTYRLNHTASTSGYDNYSLYQPRMEVGDINNDGKAEIVLIEPNGVKTYNYNSELKSLDLLNNISTEIYYWEGDISKTMLIDLDNDNYNDLVYFRTGINTAPVYFVLKGSSNGLNQPVSITSNGDSMANSYFLTGKKVHNLIFGDLDANGALDINLFSEKSEPEFNRYNINFKYLSPYPNPKDLEILLILDYNSDGVSDYLIKDKNDKKCYFWTPSNNSANYKDSEGYAFTYDHSHIYPIDLDGDGQIDLVTGKGFSDTQTWTFYKNDKGKFTNQGDVEFFHNPLKKISASVSDFDSDGVADLITAGGDGNFWAISIPSIQKQHLVSSITNGERVITSFTYKYFTNYEDG